MQAVEVIGTVFGSVLLLLLVLLFWLFVWISCCKRSPGSTPTGQDDAMTQRGSGAESPSADATGPTEANLG